MDAEAITIISGLVLLVVFALVGLNVRRRSARRRHEGSPPREQLIAKIGGNGFFISDKRRCRFEHGNACAVEKRPKKGMGSEREHI